MCDISDLNNEPVILNQSVLDNVNDILAQTKRLDRRYSNASPTLFHENTAFDTALPFHVHYHPHEGIQPE